MLKARFHEHPVVNIKGLVDTRPKLNIPMTFLASKRYMNFFRMVNLGCVSIGMVQTALTSLKSASNLPKHSSNYCKSYHLKCVSTPYLTKRCRIKIFRASLQCLTKLLNPSMTQVFSQ